MRVKTPETENPKQKEISQKNQKNTYKAPCKIQVMQ